MAVTLSINSGKTSNITTYSVTEDSTGVDPTDSSGGVGQVNITIDEKTTDAISEVREVVRTNLVENPSAEFTSESNVIVRQNLIIDSDFENDALYSYDWYKMPGSSYVDISRSTAYLGLNSGVVSAAAFAYVTPVRKPRIAASNTYTFSAYVKGESGKLLSIGVDEYTSGNVLISSSGSGDITMTGNWQRISVTRTMAANGYSVLLGIQNRSGIPQTFNFDAVLFEKSATLMPYLDPSQIPGNDYTYALFPLVDGTTSPGVFYTLTQFSKDVPSFTSNNAVISQSSEWSSTGTKSIRVSADSYFTNTSANVTVETVVGATYTIQAKIRLSAALTGTLNNNSRKIAAYDSSNSIIAISSQAPNSAGVTLLSLTFAATTQTTKLTMFNGASIGNGSVWWDDISIVDSPTLETYFDGSTADTTTYNYAWKNPTLANRSASTKSTVQKTATKTSLSGLYINDPISITDTKNGSISGTVNSVEVGQVTTSLSGDSLAKKLLVNIDAGPFVGTLSDAFAYYFSLGSITLSSDYIIDKSFTYTNVAFQGFSGELWTYVKNLCVVYGAEISLVSNKLIVRPIRQNSIVSNKNISKSLSVRNNKLAQSIEAYYYNSAYRAGVQIYPNNLSSPTIVEDGKVWVWVTGTGWVLQPNPNKTSLAGAQLMSVEANGYSEYEIPISASLFSLSRGQYSAGDTPAPIDYRGIGSVSGQYNPVLPNNGIILEPTDSTLIWSSAQGDTGVSYYSVIGKNNVEITRSQWAADGGRVEVYITNNGNSLKFKIYGSRDSTNNGPFRLAYSDSIDIYPYVKVKANAVQLNKQKINISTGTPASKSAELIGATVDNIFVATAEQAVTLGVVTAGNWCAPQQNISISSSSVADSSNLINGQQVLGNVAGARLRDDNAMYRVRSATITESGVSYTAERDTLFSDFDSIWTAKTFTEFDSQFVNKTFADFAVIPLWITS